MKMHWQDATTSEWRGKLEYQHTNSSTRVGVANAGGYIFYGTWVIDGRPCHVVFSSRRLKR